MIQRLKSAWRKELIILKAIDWADVIVRAFKTFTQTAITYAVAAITGVNFSKELSGTFWLGFLLSAGAAGVSATWNSILLPVLNPKQARTIVARAKTGDESNG